MFDLGLSIPFSGNVNDTITTGSAANGNLASFKVVSLQSSSVIRCQMTAVASNPNIPIPAGTPTLDQLVINTSITSPSLTGVGTYPLDDGTSGGSGTPPAMPNVSVSSSFDLILLPGTVAQLGQIVQANVIKTGGVSGVAVFQIGSISGGSAGSQPKIRCQNLNDIEGNFVNQGTFIYSLPEFGVSRMGAYGMGRNWMASADGTKFVAGDLVGSSTGSSKYDYTDSILKSSQNYFLANGGTFSIPSAGEQIRAMKFTAQLDTSLGQGPLQVFTEDTVFSCKTPSDMATWSTMTSPILVQGLIGSGAAGQDSIAQSNSDLLFRLSNGGVQSMLLARLDFNKWGNTPVSREINRIIASDDPALLQYCSMVVFDDRLLMTCKPTESDRGVYHKSIAALNFDPIGSLAGKQPAVWDGEWIGLNVLQFITGFFDGVMRCFAICLSSDLKNIEIHEILYDGDATQDNTNSPVTWFFESPQIFPQDQSHQYKRLIDGEVYINNLETDVTIEVYYKPDQNTEWTYWNSTQILMQTNDNGFRPRIGLGQPNPRVMDEINDRPMREGYDFQVKVIITGACQFLGGRFAADLIPQPEFKKPTT